TKETTRTSWPKLGVGCGSRATAAPPMRVTSTVRTATGRPRPPPAAAAAGRGGGRRRRQAPRGATAPGRGGGGGHARGVAATPRLGHADRPVVLGVPVGFEVLPEQLGLCAGEDGGRDLEALADVLVLAERDVRLPGRRAVRHRRLALRPPVRLEVGAAREQPE